MRNWIWPVLSMAALQAAPVAAHAPDWWGEMRTLAAVAATCPAAQRRESYANIEPRRDSLILLRDLLHADPAACPGAPENAARAIFRLLGEPEAADADATLLGMAHAAALLYGPTIEQAWHAHHGDGLLQIMWGSGPELLAALQVHELDLVIAPRPRRYQASGIRRHTLHTSTPTVHARVGHPLAAATSLDAIRHAGWAVAGRAGTAGNVIEEAHRVRGLPDPRILVQCGDYPTMLNLVARSDLLCVVPHPALLPVQDAPTVQALHLREGLPQYDVCLFWRARRRGQDGDAAMSAVVAALKALAADGGTATGTDAPGGRPG